MGDVRLVVAHNLVGHLLPGVEVFEIDGGPKHYPAIRIDRFGVNNLSIGQFGFKFKDAPLDEALALFGSIVVRIFRKIALGARFRNSCDDAGALDMFEPMQFLSKEFSAADSQWNSCHASDSLSLQTSVQGLQ